MTGIGCVVFTATKLRGRLPRKSSRFGHVFSSVLNLRAAVESWAGLLHETPGLSVNFVPRPRSRKNPQGFSVCNHAGWENVPSVFWKNVSGEKIDIVATVCGLERAYRGDAIVSPLGRLRQDRLDLNAPEYFARTYHKVVVVGLSPGLGD